MAKLTRRERSSILVQIDNLLENHCRECPNNSNRGANPICITCPIGVKLKGLGECLDPNKAFSNLPPKATRKRWSDAEDALVLQLRNDGMIYREIGVKLGRPKWSVINRLRRLQGYHDKKE